MGAEGRPLMQVRRIHLSGRRSLSASLCLAAVTVAAGLTLTACGHPASHTAATTAKQCGGSRTAANVPVTVQVNSAAVACSTVLSIEKDYARAIDEGKAPGNGGGGPVPVDGWTCEGFATPKVLQTGEASKCVKGKMEILATLSTPAS